MLDDLFGSPLRVKILQYIVECSDAYSLELTRQFKRSLFSVQSQLKKLEQSGVLVSRSVGKTRLFTFNPRYPLKAELTALLRKNLEFVSSTEIQKNYRPRKRPRRAGKPM